MARKANRSANHSQKVSSNRNNSNRRSNRKQEVIISEDDNSFKREKKKNIELIPRSVNQESLLFALEDKSKHIVFAIGPAGSGKTILSTRYAVKQLKEQKIDKIVISRPNIAVDDKDIGFLPGDVTSKMAPWTRPIIAEMEEFFTKQEIEYMIKEDIIEILPLAFIRGRTLKNAVILLDEAQNTTPTSLLSAMTRIGENSKMIVTGDIKQSDRPNVKNGLVDFIKRYEQYPTNKISVIRFDNKDVQRHPVIVDVLNMYKDLDIG